MGMLIFLVLVIIIVVAVIAREYSSPIPYSKYCGCNAPR